MTVKGGKHQLTGIVQLGNFYNNIKKIESRMYRHENNFFKEIITVNIFNIAS